MASKKIKLKIAALLFIAMLFPNMAFAQTKAYDINSADMIIETNNPEIAIAFFISDEPQTFAYSSVNKTGTGYFYKTASGDKIADFNCTGSFNYDGTICNVVDIQTSVWNTIQGYKVTVSKEKNQISPTYAQATGLFNLYAVSGSSQTLTSSATINVYCNQKGNTTVEFNSD